MKVKNIMFSGFMAAILMSATGAADAAISVASKDYVDSKAGVIATSLSEYKTANDAKVNKNAADIATNAGSIATVSGALSTLSGVVDTKVAQSAYDAKVAELVKADSDNLAAAKKYTDDEISELNESLAGTTGDLTTLTQTVADLDAAYKLADQGLAEDISANADAIAAINDVNNGILKQAQTYADQAEADAISTAAADATSKANQALTDAKAYTDALENGAVKANADAIAALDTTYVSESEMNTFKASNTDAIADAKKAGTDAAAALTAYETENDAALAGVKTTAEKGVSDAAAAAQAAANAAAAAAKALDDAKTYADGKDAETLASAKTYAEGQASAAQAAAEATAAADATSKANAAQAAAEATAAADATSKANAAQAAAEATAAADATSKANAAQAAAEATAASALSSAKTDLENALKTKITAPAACETQDCVLSINKSTGTISWTPLTEPVDDYLN